MEKPIVVARHAFGDQYKATDLKIDVPGTLTLTFTPKDGAPQTHEVFTFTGPGVGMAMFNTVPPSKGFARSCFNYGLQRNIAGVSFHPKIPF
jgi:isocitrate dehydrogenase